MIAPTAATRSPRPISRDFMTGAAAGAALLMFAVIIGGVFIGPLGRPGGAIVDTMLIAVMLMNVTLILFAWFRYRTVADREEALREAGRRAHLPSQHDPLTGFLNRRSLIEEGAALFTGSHRRRKALALLTIDLDHFKSVNDVYGYATGDALLAQVAAAIAALVPESSLLARLNADEFACAVVFNPAHPSMVDGIAECLIAGLAKPFSANGAEIHVSTSIGIARSDRDCASIEALLRTSDMALHVAKVAGRNRFAWFDGAMERSIQLRRDLESGLRRAIPNNDITPCFEQQIDLATNRITGFEVIARWDHPTRGQIASDVFIPIAEDIGLIGDLSLSVLRQAFTAARDWDAALTLSVNISPLQLRDAWLAQKIIKTLVETGFPASRLEIEITERALFDNLPLAQSIVSSLKNQGIRIALDDFGTGYSSLAHLRALPFDRIKVDKSFVASMLDNPDSMAIVNTIVRLGDSLNMPTTAEGIKDIAAEHRLRAIGCARGQGDLYGRPLNVAQVRRLLAEKCLLAHQSDDDFPPIPDTPPRLTA